MSRCTSFPGTGPGRSPLQAAALALGLLCAAAGPVASQTMHGASADGEWRLELLHMPDPVQLNQMISPVLHLSKNGAKVPAGTSVTLTGLRTFTRNALPTGPQAVALNTPGEYQIEGLRFHIAGPWRLTFTIKSGTNGAEIIMPVEVK